jgi:DNA (cytosine-5)-methyltransferase 1
MKMLDLFSGIGGFALAAQRVWGDELDIAGFCEIDDYCCKVLNKNFPNVPIHNDIKKLDGNQFSDIFLMTGGFPCQDISIAGKGEGIEGERSGLWSEMCRLISEVRPRYALIENVPMLIHRGLERVLCDLAEIGYDAEWQVIGADEVGAWHQRKRVWIVAYPRCEHGERKKVLQKYEKQDRKKNAIEFKRSTKRNRERITSRTEEFSNSNSSRRKEQWWTESIQEKFITAEYSSKTKGSYWITEPNVGRVANGISNRVDRLKGLGNAIVPQCSEVIMEIIKCQYY